MNALLLLDEDAETVVAGCEATGAKVLDPANGRFTGHGKSLSLTVWAEYETRPSAPAVLHNIYTHRMRIKQETRRPTGAAGPSSASVAVTGTTAAATAAAVTDQKQLICAKCRLPLEEIETKFEYLKHEFAHPVPKCPICGQPYIPETLANGKMLEVETMLEDK
jgi:hypothetical protein